MGWLGKYPLYTLLALSEKPAQCKQWQILLMALALALAMGLAWGAATGSPVLAWAVVLGLAAFAAADWALLASLPRWGISFGAVQSPWSGLILARWLLVLVGTPAAVRWPLPTMAGLATLQAAIWGLVAYGTLVEPFRLQVTNLDLSSDKLSNPGKPLRIAHLSDLHVERLTRRDRALPPLVAGLAPDLVVLTGDFLNASYNADPLALADLGALLGQIHAPGGTYAVWGTAEVDLPHLLRPVLQDAGVFVLADQAVEVTIQDHRLWLMGVSCSRDLAADGARLRSLMAGAPPGALTLLLYHTPDLMPQAASLGVDLYLAGHTHGGQWRLPGFGAILTSSHYWKRYEAGCYHEAGTHLYVSRGLGMEGYGAPRARFFCPPELVSITLLGKAERG
jgi:predicted MPP superfamily phosphohydrolase